MNDNPATPTPDPVSIYVQFSLGTTDTQVRLLIVQLEACGWSYVADSWQRCPDGAPRVSLVKK